MTFPTYTNVFTNAPVQSTFPSYLALNFTSITSAPLEWVFQNQNTVYPFSNTIQVTVNAVATNSIVMPDATATSVGQETTIINSGAATILVKDHSGGLIETILTTQSWQIQLTDNSTVAGTWVPIQNGALTSSASATSLIDSTNDSNSHSNAGGLAAFPTNFLKQNKIVNTFTVGSTYNQASGDRGNILVWQSGTGNYNCLSAAVLTNGFIFTIQNNSTSGGGITVVPAAGNTINNSALPFTILPNAACSFVSDGVATLYSYAFSQDSTTVTDLVDIDLTTQISDIITLTTLQASYSIQKYINVVGSGPYPSITINYPLNVIAEYIAYNNSSRNSLIIQINGEASSSYQYTIAPGNRMFLFSDGTHLYNAPNVLSQSTISLTDGTAALPSFNFTSDITTGLFREIGGSYIGDLAVTQGGVATMAFGNTKNVSLTNLQTLEYLWTLDGTAALPGISFTNDVTTGLFRGISGTYNTDLQITQSGVARMAFGTINTSLNNFQVIGVLSHSDGTAALPSITFTNDATTGLFRQTTGAYTGKLEVTVGGTGVMVFDGTNTSLTNFDVENGSITQQLISIYSLMRAYG